MDELQAIDEFANELERLTLAFEKAYDKALLELISEIIVWAAENMNLGEITTEQAISENIAQVTQLRSQLRALITHSELEKVIKAYILEFGIVAAKIDKYMMNISSAYSVTKGLRLTLINGIQLATDSLLNAGLDTAVLNPVQNLLNRAAIGNMNLSALTKMLKKEIGKNAPQIRYAKQIASDALHVFVRQYQNVGAEKLGLQHYVYAGTAIATSRPFCKTRIGKAFSKQDVEKWPKLDWEGKNAATDAKSIFWLCGGYNCRHQLRPISETTYKKLIINQ